MTAPAPRINILYTTLYITAHEIAHVNDAVTHGCRERYYEHIFRFEEVPCQRLDVKHAIATSSCTSAMHTGLSALGIGEGDEIILATINFAPATYLKANPVLADILPDTWCLDPAAVEATITPRTMAIVGGHRYCNLCDVQRPLPIGQSYGIPVIEHSGEAIGSAGGSKREGSFTAPEAVAEDPQITANGHRMLALFDSNNSEGHVLAGLEAYAPMVPPGSYCVVFDTAGEDLPDTALPDRACSRPNSPKTAVRDHVRIQQDDRRPPLDGSRLELRIYESIENKLTITAAPGSFLFRPNS